MRVDTAADNLDNAGVVPGDLVASGEKGGIEIIDRLADEWRTLCREASQDLPFCRPEWISAFLRAFLPESKVLVVTVRHHGRLQLILPLVVERGFFYGVPLRKLRAPVNSHSCHFDAVRRAGTAGDAAVLAAWDYLQKIRGWDVLELTEVSETGALSDLMRAAQDRGYPVGRIAMRPTPFVPVPDNIDILKQLPRNARLRGKLRQIRRELAPLGHLRLRRFEQADPATLERFYKLEAAGWKGQEGSAITCDANTRQFYDEVAHFAERFGYLSLYFLELNDQLLAGHFGLSQDGRYFSPKVAYDEKLKDWAPGHLIVSEILQDCMTRKISSYDITGPDDEWKMKWTAQLQPKYELYIFQKGLSGRLAQLIRFRLHPRVANFVRRRGPGA
jgi:CelD/BcsL family acetyltransferase involved in cellulose biosynthesis